MSSSEELAKLLDESKMQVTFTGWKAELEQAEKQIEQLKAENEKVYDALAGNICGYCWQKMEEEPTAKRTHQDHVNELLAEITALKSKLEIAKKGLEFYANGKNWQNFDLEHEADPDCEADYEHLNPERPRLITGGKKARQALKEIEG